MAAHLRERDEAGGSSRARPRERMCAACHETSPPESLVRWVLGPEGEVAPDLGARAFGRGAWIHPNPGCLKRLPEALAKSFRSNISTSREQATELLAEAARVQVGRLLGQARRQRLLSEGGTLTEQAFQDGRTVSILVAQDAARATFRPWLEKAIAAGQARIWSTKDELGRIWGRPEVAVLGILDQRLAKRIFGGIAMALLTPEQISPGKRNQTPDRRPATEDE